MLNWKTETEGWEAEIDASTVARVTFSEYLRNYTWSVGPKTAWTRRARLGSAETLEDAQRQAEEASRG